MVGPRLDDGTISPAGKLVRFHGGKPKQPAQSQRESLLSAQAEKELLKSLIDSRKPMEIPKMEAPPAAPVPSPPPTMSNADVMAAQKQAKKVASKRRGIKSTLLSTELKQGVTELGGSLASMATTLA